MKDNTTSFKAHLLLAPSLMFFALVFSFQIHAEETEEAGALQVQVRRMRNSKGVLRCALFKGEEGFPEDRNKATIISSSISDKGRGTCVFQGFDEGTYAVMVLHDEDEDGEMKFSAFGTPEEGYAASNNAKDGFLSGPDYEDAKFDYDGKEKSIMIYMRYW